MVGVGVKKGVRVGVGVRVGTKNVAVGEDRIVGMRIRVEDGVADIT
jgi:hypothetical protein